MKNIACGIVVALLATACASVQRVAPAPIESSERHVVDRNYTLGREGSAYVGQPVVRVKDYWVRTDHKVALKASENFSIRHPWFGVGSMVSTNDSIAVVGVQDRGGKQFRVVRLPGPLTVGFLLNADGTFDGRGVDANGLFMGYTYKVQPATVTLLPGTAEHITSNRGFVNFEIVYSGTTKGELNLLYREYSAQDLARPAFTQNLTYSRDSDYIRFRDVRIRILEANNERIRYIVEQDGLTNS